MGYGFSREISLDKRATTQQALLNSSDQFKGQVPLLIETFQLHDDNNNDMKINQASLH